MFWSSPISCPSFQISQYFFFILTFWQPPAFSSYFPFSLFHLSQISFVLFQVLPFSLSSPISYLSFQVLHYYFLSLFLCFSTVWSSFFFSFSLLTTLILFHIFTLLPLTILCLPFQIYHYFFLSLILHSFFLSTHCLNLILSLLPFPRLYFILSYTSFFSLHLIHVSLSIFYIIIIIIFSLSPYSIKLILFLFSFLSTLSFFFTYFLLLFFIYLLSLSLSLTFHLCFYILLFRIHPTFASEMSLPTTQVIGSLKIHRWKVSWFYYHNWHLAGKKVKMNEMIAFNGWPK